MGVQWGRAAAPMVVIQGSPWVSSQRSGKGLRQESEENVCVLGLTYTHTPSAAPTALRIKTKSFAWPTGSCPLALCWSHVGFLLVSWVYHDPSCHKGSLWNVPIPIQELTPIHPWGLSFPWFLRRISSYPLPAPLSVPLLLVPCHRTILSPSSECFDHTHQLCVIHACLHNQTISSSMTGTRL